MGFGPVPYSAIVHYAEWNGIAEFATLLRCVREMDRVWLDHMSREISGENPPRQDLTPEHFDSIFA